MSDLSELEDDVLEWVNRARTNPSSIIDILRSYILHVDDSGVYCNPVSGAKVLLKEGTGVIIGCVEFLRGVSPQEPLEIENQLKFCAKDLAKELGKSGKVSYEGDRQESFSSRVQLYLEGKVQSAGENISVFEEEGLSVALDWIIDDGNPERTRRLNVFNEE